MHVPGFVSHGPGELFLEKEVDLKEFGVVVFQQFNVDSDFIDDVGHGFAVDAFGCLVFEQEKVLLDFDALLGGKFVEDQITSRRRRTGGFVTSRWKVLTFSKIRTGSYGLVSCLFPVYRFLLVCSLFS